MLLHVASAYKTVSAVALNVITGISPTDLLILEKKPIHECSYKDKEAVKINN